MVQITDIPLQGKMKEKFLSFFEHNSLEEINLGDFGKWEGGGNCAVCGHGLIWSFRERTGRDIGICCATNILALRRCNGNFDELNFKRTVELEKRTIMKRQREWEKEQKAMQLEIKYNDEFKYCTAVVESAFNEDAFETFIGESKYGKFFYVDDHRQGKAMDKIKQCYSWLDWMQNGSVNEYHLEKLRVLIKENPYPKGLINEAKEMLKKEREIAEQKAKERDLNYDYFSKVLKIKKLSLGMYDVKFVKSLSDFFDTKGYYTDKQREAIDKLMHRYRKQLGDAKNG